MNTLSLMALITAIHVVETNASRDPRMGDEGPLQIERIFVRDVNRIIAKEARKVNLDRKTVRTIQYTLADRRSLTKSREMASIYMTYWLEKTPKADRDKYGDIQVMARLFHRGPKKWKDAKGGAYWGKVVKAAGGAK